MSLSWFCRIPAATAAALDALEPEERDSVLESLARQVLEETTDRLILGQPGRRPPVGLMHRLGAPARLGSSPGALPFTGRNTARFARV